MARYPKKGWGAAGWWRLTRFSYITRSIANRSEALLSACERIIGGNVPKRGPTEVNIDPSFQYEVYFIGNMRAIESLTLGSQVSVGDTGHDRQHPVWSFLTQLRDHTGGELTDTFSGTTVDPGE